MAGRGVDRLVAALLQACCRQLWGFAPRMIPHIVASKGPFGALRWFAVNMPRYFRTMHVLGPLRTHLSCMVISLYNGCIYCAYGHGYALELIYLRDRDRLFPLDASTLSGWLHLGPRELNERLRTVLQDAGMHGEAVWVDLTLDLLRGQQQPVDENEARLVHLIEMLGAMNAIAVAAAVEPDGAQNPINKNAAMKARNAQLRAAAV
jgi:ribosomal protein L12E/L44/L45/RPP1/RPP2